MAKNCSDRGTHRSHQPLAAQRSEGGQLMPRRPYASRVALAVLWALGSGQALAAAKTGEQAQPLEAQAGTASAKGVSIVTQGPGASRQDETRRDSDTDWPTYNNDFLSQRYSSLTQINASNVASLREECRVELGDKGALHAGLVLVDGVIYLTAGRDTFAVDAANCAVLWKSTWVPEAREVWVPNRGGAYMNGRIFRGTGDGRVIALDARTGEQLWKTVAGDPDNGEFFSAAPIAKNGLVYMGTGGSDWGIRGRMMAFDAATGKEVWRFHTVPRPGERGAETWKSAKAASTGGGGTWSSFTLDEKANEIFIPVANPAPDFLPTYRLGDNLYTNSIVVLDAKTGKLKWWYQLTPGDGRDLDLVAPPALYHDSKGVPMVAAGSKDGFAYLINRNTHGLRAKTVVTTMTDGGDPTPDGVYTCPGVLGGVEWNGPAFDPANQSLYVGAVDWCAVLKSAKPEYKKGEFFFAGSYTMVDTPPNGWITALDATTGGVKWKYEVGSSMVAGITPTAGGVLLTGDMAGNFLALDSKTGKLLHKINTRGAMAGGVITYSLGGKQYVAATSGNVSRATFGVLGKPSLVVLALGADAKTAQADQPAKAAPQRTSVPAKGPEAANIARGKATYGTVCSACHGPSGEGGVGLKLQSLSSRLSWEGTLDKIVNPKLPMPTLYPSMLSEQEVIDVAAYIRSL